MVYLTGDTHRNFKHVVSFCRRMETTTDDVLVILGDAGINYYDEEDWLLKIKLRELPISLLCIHGNHEKRPEACGYSEREWRGGKVYWEPEFPNLLFAKDGEVYELAGKRCMAIGGAYSVDKPVRIAQGYGWWPDEQPSKEIKARVERRLEAESWQMDVILSHTCPRKYEPVEVFMKSIDQSGVDKATENWLDSIEDRLDYRLWFCGHFHVNKTIDRLRFMANDFYFLE